MGWSPARKRKLTCQMQRDLNFSLPHAHIWATQPHFATTKPLALPVFCCHGPQSQTPHIEQHLYVSRPASKVANRIYSGFWPVYGLSFPYLAKCKYVRSPPSDFPFIGNVTNTRNECQMPNTVLYPEILRWPWSVDGTSVNLINWTAGWEVPAVLAEILSLILRKYSRQ